MKDSLSKSALRYFEYLAKKFPVMCASDEFHFLPRVQAAGRYYDRLDNLEADAIDECLADLKQFQKEFNLAISLENDLEKHIDLELLNANIAGILIEFEKSRSWRHNPLLYLKIAFIGLDHALTKPAKEQKERIERTNARISAIPRLLNQAMDNIDSIPESYHKAASTMLNDCKEYLFEIGDNFLDESPKRFKDELQNLLSALNDFSKFLSSISPLPDQSFAFRSLEDSLKDHFLYIRSLDEVFEIAIDEWHENLKQLEKLQSKIDTGKSWQMLYHNYFPSDIEEMDTFSLYYREIEHMRLFFSKHGFRDKDIFSSLELVETPTYLKSVRGAASFAAAFTADQRETSLFYITNRLPQQISKEAGNLLKKRLHREYKFLTAHETIPGHHLLDSARRRLDNPIRRQIESPFFYEGWASYVESLLTEYGYINRPIEYLLDFKRRLWRSARCQIDVGLHTGALSIEDAINLLTTVGFTLEESKRQIDRFRLNPGYQICYSLGSHEIQRLKESYESRIGKDKFHAFLLEGGELPFHLIKKRFEAALGLIRYPNEYQGQS